MWLDFPQNRNNWNALYQGQTYCRYGRSEKDSIEQLLIKQLSPGEFCIFLISPDIKNIEMVINVVNTLKKACKYLDKSKDELLVEYKLGQL